ncbi:MAG: endonuclease domain-containing protein [Rhodospirillales bacterium]|nr:endonuclease domain-containing protein [Rhodospirillales bacterium]MBO6787352.1 endonuclease domain-containing protein [Rhodospirillales bacterium]
METPFTRARRLRLEMSPPERKVWAVLRARGLKGWKFRRQVPVGPFIVDFLCAEKRLVLEIDGESHSARLAYDKRRDAYLHAAGYRVLRLTNEQVTHELEASMHLVIRVLETL